MPGKRGSKPAPREQRRWAWIIAACLIPICLAGLSLYVQGLTMRAWNAVVEYRSQYLFDLEPVPATGDPGTEGVLLIIVDGLRVDNSKLLDTWNAARNGQGSIPAGADLTAIAGQPSLSDPAAAVIPSGTSQEIHGVTTNWYEGLLKVDNLFESARRSAKSTVVVAGKGWVDLYGDSIDRMYQFDDSEGTYDQMVFEQAMEVLTGGAPLPDLMVVHFGGVDHDSHEYGGSSPEALATAKVIDGYIAQLLAAWDLDKRTAILTSDHGHIATGGHGGWELEVITTPLVMAGKAVKPGTYPAASQCDIAPTICALLGMSMPSHSIGTVLDGVIDLGTEDMAKAFADLGQARHAFTREYLAGTNEALIDPEGGGGPAEVLAEAADKLEAAGDLLDQAWVHIVAGNPDMALQTAKEALWNMDETRASVREVRLGVERGSRMIPALLLALLPLVPLFFLSRNRRFGLAVGGAVLYFAAYHLLFFVVHGYRWSLSIFNSEDLVESFFNSRMLEAAILAVLAGAVVGILVGLKRDYDGPELAESAATTSYFIAYVLGLQVILFFYLYGVSFDWFIPNLVWGFKFYVDLLQVVPTGLASVLVVPVALLFAKLAASLGGARSARPPVGTK